jgi:excisionase family DNA binding protein
MSCSKYKGVVGIPKNSIANQISPKDLALVIGVSESSVKRWIDQGRLNAQRTEGGHRRISMTDALRFIKEENYQISNSEVFTRNGLPDKAESIKSETELVCALRDGDASAAANIILFDYLAGETLPNIFHTLSPYFHKLGNDWPANSELIAEEHHSSTTFYKALSLLEPYIQPESANKIAVGGTLAPDSSVLSSMMVELVAQSAGLRTVNLGGTTPIQSFLDSANQHNASLVWVCIVHQPDLLATSYALQFLSEELENIGVELAFGGPGLTAESGATDFLMNNQKSLEELFCLASSLAKK